MRIVSLLPSLTELVAALGHQADLVGVTHECDYPPGVERLRPLTRSHIPTGASSAEIDGLVASQAGSLYALDAEALAELRPDLILTQSQCDVCAVSEPTVRAVAASLPGNPPVESVNPRDLAGLFAMFRRVGDVLGPQARQKAEAIVTGFEATAAAIASRRQGQARPRVALLEWTDPLFVAGHWNPELIAWAGGDEVLGQVGVDSHRTGWDALQEAAPEVLIVAPCGFALGRVAAETHALARQPGWADLPAVRTGRVVLADGNALFSRPGPRLEQALRVAAVAIDPERCADLAPTPDLGLWAPWRA